MKSGARMGVALALVVAVACESSNDSSGGAPGGAGSGTAGAGTTGSGGRFGAGGGGTGHEGEAGGANSSGADGGVGGRSGGGGQSGGSDGGGQGGNGGQGGQGGAGAGGAPAGGGGGTAGSGGQGATPVVAQIAAGGNHTCAVVAKGEVFCWGDNSNGQLGDGTTTQRTRPTPVLLAPGGPALAGVKAVALGDDHSCALRLDGTVVCWGDNQYGQLGDGTTADRHHAAPVLVAPGGAPLAGVGHLALGGDHGCAVVSGGEVRCWGSNTSLQLGDGTHAFNRPNPVTVVLPQAVPPPLTGAHAVELGLRHSCALLDDGKARCWGWNYWGELGVGYASPTNQPWAREVLTAPDGPPLQGVSVLAVGASHSCVLVGGDDLRCWGRNYELQLGVEPIDFAVSPSPVVQGGGGPPLEGAKAIALGEEHSCALLVEGGVRCWGENGFGELGDGTTTDRRYPVTVLASPQVPLAGGRALALGRGHSCTLLPEGEARCWGRNGSGQLGDGTTSYAHYPVIVTFD